MLFFSILLLVVGVVALAASAVVVDGKSMARLIGVVALVVGIVLGVLSCLYTQSEGEAKVLKSVTGEITGSDINAGMDFKAPWIDTIDFDVTNQQAIYKLEGQPTTEGETVNGPKITFQDKDKVTADADIAIRYSIDPSKVEDIVREYQSQEGLTVRLIDQDIRSVVRNTFAGYTTAQALEQRAKVEADIASNLAKRWEGSGVVVESVALQNIQYPQATVDGFTTAQQSVTNLKTAEADLLVKEKQTQQAVIEAEANADAAIAKAKGEAEANRLVSKSITPELLKKQEIEAFAKFGENGNSIVMGGSGEGIFDMRGKGTPVESK